MSTRSQRTEARIRQALLDLLENQTYESVTISDIARSAGCHRTTVYRHHPDKESVLLACYEEIAETVKEGLIYPRQTPDISASQIAYANILAFYTHVADNRALYQALFASAAGSSIRTRFRRLVAGFIVSVMAQEGTVDALPIRAGMVGNLIADMIVGAIVWWLETGSAVDIAQLAEITLRLAETGFFGLTGQAVREEDISATAFPANW